MTAKLQPLDQRFIEAFEVGHGDLRTGVELRVDLRTAIRKIAAGRTNVKRDTVTNFFRGVGSVVDSIGDEDFREWESLPPRLSRHNGGPLTTWTASTRSRASRSISRFGTESKPSLSTFLLRNKRCSSPRPFVHLAVLGRADR